MGCDRESQVAAPASVPSAALAKKPSKKCGSNRYAVYGINTWAITIVDTTVTPPDTVFWNDCGYIFSMARSCDALYLAIYHGGLKVLDLLDPTRSLGPPASDYPDIEFFELRISGSNLYARYERWPRRLRRELRAWFGQVEYLGAIPSAPDLPQAG